MKSRPPESKRELLALAKEAGRAAARSKAERIAKDRSAYELPETWDPEWSVRLPETEEHEAARIKATALQAAQEYWGEFVSDRRDEESIERD